MRCYRIVIITIIDYANTLARYARKNENYDLSISRVHVSHLNACRFESRRFSGGVAAAST